MSTGLGRAASIPAGPRLVYDAAIRHFVATGATPSVSDLARDTGLDDEEVTRRLDELVTADWIGRDASAAIVALYPFSPSPSGISVTVDGHTRDAMCAVDALGVAPLLGRPVTVAASCPVCDAPIRVHVSTTGITRRRPRSAVVIRRRTPGAAHRQRCAATRFACSPPHADQWLQSHGGPHDELQSLEGAFLEGRRLFGGA